MKVTIQITTVFFLVITAGPLSGKEKGFPHAARMTKTDPSLSNSIPPELKDIEFTTEPITVVSDDYQMGDWQETPSKIIYHDGWYHMWIIDIPQRGAKVPKGKTVTTYLKSRDGKVWLDRGRLPAGKKGSFDDADWGRLAPDVVKYNDKFYLFYEPMTTNIKKYRQCRCGIAALVADKPEGPWTYAAEELLLTPSIDDPEAWDHLFVTNPRIERLNGKWFMYYKARKRNGQPTQNGIAVADNLLGPYTKYKGNPIATGHSAFLLKYKHGLIYFLQNEKSRQRSEPEQMFWTENGTTFARIGEFGKDQHGTLFQWSAFFDPNNPLYGGDPSRPEPEAYWGVTSSWRSRIGYGSLNNDIIGLRLRIAASRQTQGE